METFYYEDEQKKRSIKHLILYVENMAFFEVIYECNYKYVIDLFEMWNDREKKEYGQNLLGSSLLVFFSYTMHFAPTD